ncbi:MAG: vWA domain-containing protein [Candidatus Rifleibacteriota bacterium]
MKTKKRDLSGFLSLIFIFIFLPLCSFAQTSGFASKILRIESNNFPEIDVTLKVFTREPTTFTSDNFKLFEDNTKIATFSINAAKATQYVMLALDRSSSIKKQMGEVKKAAAVFVKTMPARVKTGIMSFGSDVQFEHKCSANKNSLLKAIQKIRPYGGTSLYDVIYQGCESLTRIGNRTDLKTMVVLTDGYDSNPRSTGQMSIKNLNEALAIARKHNIKLFMLGLGDSIDKKVMIKFARETKGAFLPAQNTDQLRTIYLKLGQRLQLEQYLALNYITPEPETDGSKRIVQIKSEWQGINNQGSGSYRAPLPPPPEPEKPEKELKLTNFEGTDLDAEIIPERYIDKELYSARKEPGIKRAMRILVESGNEQLRAGYQRLNSTLKPIFSEWNQHVADQRIENLAQLRDQAISELENYQFVLENVLDQVVPAALEIAETIPDKNRRFLAKQGVKSRCYLLRTGLKARIYLLKQNLKTNTFWNKSNKKQTEFRNKTLKKQFNRKNR